MELFTVEEFAARRRIDQDEMEKSIFPYVSQALDRFPAEGWYNDLLQQVGLLYVDVFHDEGGKGQPKPSSTEFVADVRSTLDKTTDKSDPERISTWLSTAILNAGTQAAAATDEEFLVMEWVTMHDEDVRPAHKEVEGATRPPGEPFDVGGFPMRYPGDPTAPIELWINCRCTLAPMLASEAENFQSTEKREAMTTATSTTYTHTFVDTEAEPDEAPAVGEPTPWHGVLAPEGVWSGDKRMFAENSLTWRDLPIPLTWQKTTEQGHDGSVVVGRIDYIERVGSEIWASGQFLQTPEADEAIGMVVEFGRYGVSVDADSVEAALDEEHDGMTFSSARISSAAMVAIPAFAQAYVALGDRPDMEQECDPETDPDCQPAEEPAYSESSVQGDTTQEFKDYDAKQRKKAHTVPGTDSYPIEDCEDLANAIRAIGRAKDPAATKRHIKTQKSRLGCPDVEIPEDWSTETVKFKRGPGWVTDPEATRRIHAYWTKKGQPGYAKINWGVPGDFNRCRTLVGEKIAKNSPEDMKYLNQICAQWHHDALGWWPGRPTSGETVVFGEGDMAPAVSLVAAGGFCAPSEWFNDPQFSGPAALTITDEGQVFGHMALWGTCHTGFKGVCMEPPKSASGYAYFLTGGMQTDKGVVPVGQLTIDGPHAPHGYGLRKTIAHYDNTTTAIADVACGEDEHGIWVAGMIRPGSPDEKVSALRAASLSGDWREIHGNLELVAALAVNSPGFPVPRVGVESGVQVSLVAAGCVACQQPEPKDDGFSVDALAEAIVLATKRIEQQTAARSAKMMALAARVRGGQ